jgi:4-amino-4-deoxy-L-arabinose transferase-like glycosyltransferase
MTVSHRLGVILFIIAVAFAVRVVAVSVFMGINAPPKGSANPDQIDYERYAYSLSLGAGYVHPDATPTADRTPGTSFFLAPVYYICGRSFLAGRLWFCWWSALTCAAVFLTAEQLWDRRIAVVAAFWLAIYPGHWYYSLHFLSEVPYAFSVVSATGLTIASLRRSSSVLGLAAGVFWGFGILTRPQLMFLLPFVWAVAVWSKPFRSRALREVFLQTAVIVAVVMPWVVRNRVVMGKATLSTVGGYTFWGTHNDRVYFDPAMIGMWMRTSDLVDPRHPIYGDELERESLAWTYGIGWARENMQRMPRLVAMKVIRLLTPFERTENTLVFLAFAVGWITAAPFAVIGLVVTWKRYRTAAVVLSLPMLGTFVSALVFYGSARFRDSVAPVYLILAAVGSVMAFDLIREAAYARPGSVTSAKYRSLSEADLHKNVVQETSR